MMVGRGCISALGETPSTSGVDDGEDFLLLLRADADALKRLPRSTVRADERLVIRAGQRRRLGVALAAQRAHSGLSGAFLHRCASLALIRSASVSLP